MSITLKSWIDEAPAVITELCDYLDIPEMGFLDPKWYRKTNPHHFDQEKAERNLPTMTAFLKGKSEMATDLEKKPRRIIRDPDDYETDEVDWATKQYESMWKWFRKQFPDHLLTEWGWNKGQYEGHMPLAEKLGIKGTDTIDASVYWKPYAGWYQTRVNYIQRAINLGQKHDKPVYLWVYDRYAKKNSAGVKVNYPVAQDDMDEMLDLAIRKGVDTVIFWSNAFKILEVNSPTHVIAETINRADYDVKPLMTASVCSMLSQMKLRAEAQ